MKLRVCIAGVTGWIGKPLAPRVAHADDMELVVAVARGAAGTTIEGAPVVASLAEALKTPLDVLVDYTSAAAVFEHVLLAVERGVHVVIGSSGLNEEQYARIDQAARERGVGVVAISNFAVSAILMQRFALEAARVMPSWEIIDYAAANKPDAPSGTARHLAARLAEIKTPQNEIPIAGTIGIAEARGATMHGTQVHSLRLPGHVIGLEILFGANDERLSIRYEGGSGPEPYIPGTLAAIRKAPAVRGLVRDLDTLS